MQESVEVARRHMGGDVKKLNIWVLDIHKSEAYLWEYMEKFRECYPGVGLDIESERPEILHRQLMDHYECNAFTAPCPDLCSTRRLSEERVTFCLTHSLNIENGIPSACDLDFNSLLTQAILENLSGKSVYMGNANVCSLEDGKLPTIFSDFDDAHIDHLDDKTNLYSIFHATPTRKFDGFEQPLKKFGKVTGIEIVTA